MVEVGGGWWREIEQPPPSSTTSTVPPLPVSPIFPSPYSANSVMRLVVRIRLQVVEANHADGAVRLGHRDPAVRNAPHAWLAQRLERLVHRQPRLREVLGEHRAAVD